MITSSKYIVINQLAPVMEAYKDSIIDLDSFFNLRIPIEVDEFKALKKSKSMMIGEDEKYFKFGTDISVYKVEEDVLYCTLEDIACFGDGKESDCPF